MSQANQRLDGIIQQPMFWNITAGFDVLLPTWFQQVLSMFDVQNQKILLNYPAITAGSLDGAQKWVYAPAIWGDLPLWQSPADPQGGNYKNVVLKFSKVEFYLPGAAGMPSLG
jgi:hypothetical protein